MSDDGCRALLWAAWMELNAIRARDGAPQSIDWRQGRPLQTSTVSEQYFSDLVDAITAELGEDAQPWPSKAMEPYLLKADTCQAKRRADAQSFIADLPDTGD